MRRLIFATLLLIASCQQAEVATGNAVAPPPPGGNKTRGKQLITQYGCPACHVIPGVDNPRGMIGPSLENIGARSHIGEKVENTPANMARWIQNPQAFNPDNAMPALGVNDADARDITAYLFTLR